MVTIELSKKHGMDDQEEYMDTLWALRDEINAKLGGYVPEEEE